MKRKVIFRIREELSEDLKQIQFIPEAKGYLLYYPVGEWCDISCNSINGSSICLTESIINL